MATEEVNLANIPDSTILKAAQNFAHHEEFGKSCSYFMLLFHRNSNFIQQLKDEFLYVLSKWMKTLLTVGGISEFISFFQTVTEVCQSVTGEVLLTASEVLFQAECVLDAYKLLSTYKGDVNNKIYFEIQQNIEQLCNMVVDRWHYRMLNDKKRNLAYSLAIQKAFREGHREILDIGSGTGILSLFASNFGFEKIYSIETSDIMCDIQRNVIAENNGSKISIINKFSTDLNIGKEIPERVSLLVTEVFDCALLGEGVVKTVKHALENLLSPNSQIIPRSADVYGVCIECKELRKHKSFRYKNVIDLAINGNKDPGDMTDQPYTTENMKTIKGGYTQLSKPFKLKTLNFNTVKELLAGIGNTETLKLPIEKAGTLDAIMVYFVLHLDDKLTISSEPDAKSCWEQALYNVEGDYTVSSGDFVDIKCTCYEEYLDISTVGNTTSSTDSTSAKKNNVLTFNTNRRIVARLNDQHYYDTYFKRILEVISEKKSEGKEKLNICLLLSDVSLIPIEVLEQGPHIVYVVEPSDAHLDLLSYNIEKHDQINVLARPLLDGKMLPLIPYVAFHRKKVKDVDIKIQEKRYFTRRRRQKSDLSGTEEDSIVFDMVISEPADYNGLLKENFLEDITFIKSLACNASTIFIPSQLTSYATCLSSNQLLIDNRVINENVTLGLRIDPFINEYKVHTHPDVDGLPLLVDSSSQSFQCHLLNLETQLQSTEDVDNFNFDEEIIDVDIEKEGDLTGLITWHELQFGKNNCISTMPSEKSHWHQSCVVFPNIEHVSKGHTIRIKRTRHKSNLYFSLI